MKNVSQTILFDSTSVPLIPGLYFDSKFCNYLDNSFTVRQNYIICSVGSHNSWSYFIIWNTKSLQNKNVVYSFVFALISDNRIINFWKQWFQLFYTRLNNVNIYFRIDCVRLYTMHKLLLLITTRLNVVESTKLLTNYNEHNS